MRQKKICPHRNEMIPSLPSLRGSNTKRSRNNLRPGLLRRTNRRSRPCAEHFSGRTRRSYPKVPAPEVQAAVRRSVNRRRPFGTPRNNESDIV